MSKFHLISMISVMLSSSAFAQDSTCRTDSPNCQGYTRFGPAAINRCISIRGQSPASFCQRVGDKQRLFVRAGDQYCAVAGSGPVPDQCDLHWITVTEPQ